MVTLVIGGAASGKSEVAEAWVLRLAGQRVYLATLEPSDEESRRRIVKHRALRAEKAFTTLERPVDLAGLSLPADCNLLLECLGTLTANERYRPDGSGEQAETAILRGIDHLVDSCAHLTVVTNEVFSGGADYAGDTLGYLRQLAALNRALAARADVVIEVVAGLCHVLKGGELLS
ncbi:MAG: bifunctional adenosylcobinamide kinase/adenosylcobinamide-phosphate guanylyltransferase [Oscillospiraceae bacterium]